MAKLKSGMATFLTGGLIGATLGILLAPKKGSETREEIKTKYNDMIANLKNLTTEEVVEKLNDQFEEIKVDLKSFEKEKSLKSAKLRSKDLIKRAEYLYNLAAEKGTAALKETAEEIKGLVSDTTSKIVKKLENKE